MSDAAPASPEPSRWLVVGLGNPGPEYELTPHNLGFLAVDRLAERHSIRVNRKEAQALVGVGRIGGREAFLAKPQTYMNLSGPSVKGLLTKHDLPASALVLVYDEVALPWGSLRIRPNGSAGGHNGVKSVIGSLGHQEFLRVRLGIGPDHPVRDMAEYVLSPLRKAHVKELDSLLDTASDAVESLLTGSAELAMTKYNRRAPGGGTEEK